MAKVDEIKLNLNGKEYTYNVNVGKAGIFKVEIGWEVAQLLGLDSGKIESDKKNDVTSPVYEAYHKFLEATKVESTFIEIMYASCYPYSEDSQGNSFIGHSSKFKLDGFRADIPAVAFDFSVYIKEVSSTGNVIWYYTKKGQGSVNYGEGDLNDPDTFYKSRARYNMNPDKLILIPYSKQSYETLLKAREGMRSISEILFNFINQDSKAIEAALMGGNILPK